MTTIITISLFIITGAIILLQKKIWQAFPNIVFPIFIGIFYYWSLAGSWLFIFDNTTKWGEKIGLHYHYLLEKMFLVQLDKDYLAGIWFIGLFILLMQVSMLYFIRKFKLIPKNQVEDSLQKDYRFAIAAFIFLVISFFIVKEVVTYSLILNESVYLNIRSPHIPLYSIHQLANWSMMVCLLIPIYQKLRGKIKYGNKFQLSILFWFSFIIGNFYLIFIGSRHEAFLCGLSLFVTSIYPYQSIKKNWRPLLFSFTVWIFILFLNDPFRSLSPIVGNKIGLTQILTDSIARGESNLYREDRTFISHHNAQKSLTLIAKKNDRDTIFYIGTDTVRINIKEFAKQRSTDPEFIHLDGKTYKIPNPHISKAYQESDNSEKLFRAISGIIFSNEIFAGHFSLYGVLHYNVPINFGLSFKNLFFSFVPSFIQKERPQDAYGYYAQQLRLPKDQGFTINHITAWYINFGLAALILGPIALALLLMTPLLVKDKVWRGFPATTPVLMISMITCFGAMLVRSGPEGIKSVLYEAILIPLILLYCFQIAEKFIHRKKT